MWRMDFRIIPIIVVLMGVSLSIISAYSVSGIDTSDDPFFTPRVVAQLRWFVLGSAFFVFFAGFDYNKLREWTWILYSLTLILLIGLFFTTPIQGVRRWYRIPFINFGAQPSELAKLVVVIALSWFLERRSHVAHLLSTALQASMIVLIPFLLILKQPDLGSAIVLCPIALVMFYFGNIHPQFVKWSTVFASVVGLVVFLVFSEVIPMEKVRSYASLVLKEYQIDRFDPNSHHHKASTMAIAFGGVFGMGWRGSEFTARGWLPTPDTDSVFPAFGEEFGFVGLFGLLAVFYSLIYFSFQVTAVAKNRFGRLLSAGVTVYLAMHILVNVGMMCGFLPITGVPLILVSYGGSSILSTMTALGILQSIYSRRFMF